MSTQIPAPQDAQHDAQRDAHDLQYVLDFYRGADAALGDEIAAVRRAERCEATAVSDGRRVAPTRAGSATVAYAFRTADGRPPRVRVGERVRCVADGAPPVRGVVSGRGEGRLTLDLEADLGPVVPAARVERDAVWLLETLRQRLGAVAAGLAEGRDVAPFAHDRVAALLQPEGASAAPAGFVPLATSEALASEGAPCALNEEQADAVRRALAQPITFLWGPPGTGKTRTLCGLVAQLLSHGQRVLVVTPSNTAADVVVTQLHPWVAAHALVGRGVVQRVGARVSAELAPELHELYVPSAVRARLEEEADHICAWLAEECATAAAEGRAGDVAMLDAEREACEADRRGLADEVARNCRVTVTPIANVHLRPELWRNFDAVIIDEASMIGLPAIAFAAGLSTGRIVIAGDFQQLGAVAAADTPAVRAWLRRDAFRVAGVPAMFAAECAAPHVAMLREQYRMPAAVADLVNDDFYLGQLRTAPSRRGPSRLVTGIGGPVVLVDTTGLEPTVPQGRRANAVHAAVVAALVDRVRTGAPRGAAPPRVGVFTLYRDQVDALRRAQHERGRERADVTATVHRAQGAEVDVAILDLCDAPGAWPTFLRAANCATEGARLLNVGLTRTRALLVVVAAVEYLERTGGAVVRRLLSRLRESGSVIDGRDLID